MGPSAIRFRAGERAGLKALCKPSMIDTVLWIGSVAKLRPTEVGDVLILGTRQSYTVYAVGSVATARQNDFSHSELVVHVPTHAEAVDIARALVVPGGRIYLSDIDTGEWSEIAE